MARQPLIENMSPKDSWCHEEADGRLLLKKAYSRLKHGTGAVVLSAPAAAALALTDLCCARGLGMVYTVIQCKESRSLPDLLYVSKMWTAVQQEEWRAMKPVVRLDRIASSHGWIRDDVLVLPFYLREARYMSPGITFLNSQHPYLIRLPDDRGPAPPSHVKSEPTKSPPPPPRSDNGGSLDVERYRVDGLRGILNELEAVYESATETFVIKFEMFNIWVGQVADRT